MDMWSLIIIYILQVYHLFGKVQGMYKGFSKIEKEMVKEISILLCVKVGEIGGEKQVGRNR